jgi:hypothetical protein
MSNIYKGRYFCKDCEKPYNLVSIKKSGRCTECDDLHQQWKRVDALIRRIEPLVKELNELPVVGKSYLQTMLLDIINKQ